MAGKWLAAIQISITVTEGRIMPGKGVVAAAQRNTNRAGRLPATRGPIMLARCHSSRLNTGKVMSLPLLLVLIVRILHQALWERHRLLPIDPIEALKYE
jgi:hypothetical protein